MIISNRLSKVANLVTIGNRVADIGCDHAYTSIYLIKNKISSKIIAMDINQGPLDRALENIKKYQYNKYIETRLSNGLDKLKKDEVDTILISGMGGNLIVDILDKNLDTVYKVKELILQPQSDIYKVREYIKRIGFMIIDEDILIDEDKYYNIIKTTNKRYINDARRILASMSRLTVIGITGSYGKTSTKNFLYSSRLALNNIALNPLP